MIIYFARHMKDIWHKADPDSVTPEIQRQLHMLDAADHCIVGVGVRTMTTDGETVYYLYPSELIGQLIDANSMVSAPYSRK